jgi:hypothetical protein
MSYKTLKDVELCLHVPIYIYTHTHIYISAYVIPSVIFHYSAHDTSPRIMLLTIKNYKCAYCLMKVSRFSGRMQITVGRGTPWPIPVTERSKARVCAQSLAATVGSNPAGGMNACLF